MTLYVLIAAIIGLGTASLIALPLVRARDDAKRTRHALAGLLGLTPLLAAATYLQIGAPAALSIIEPAQVTPASETGAPPSLDAEAVAAMPESDRQQMIETMVSGLAARLNENDGTIEEWRMLARSYGALGRPDKQLAAWRVITARADATLADKQGFVLAWANARATDEEPIEQEIKDILAALQTDNANDPMALYFLGVAARQDGDIQRAIDLWSQLDSEVPNDQPLASMLDDMITDAKAEL